MSVKTMSDLKAMAINFEREHRIVPKLMSATTAVSLMAVPVSADEYGSSGIDYDAIKTSLVNGLTSIVTNTIAVASAIIPIAVGAWGLTIIVSYAKKFFTKIAS